MQRAFIVFEGGGAKGISHIGAVQAIERSKQLQIQGCAGTSAGSIIAALVAAGYSSDEIFRYDRKTEKVSSVFDHLPENFSRPLDLFKPIHWKRLSLARSLVRQPRWFWIAAIIIVFILAMVPLISWAIPDGLCGEGPLRIFCFILSKVAWFFYAAEMAIFSLFLAFLLMNVQGIASLQNMVDALDQLLARKIAPKDGRRVTFGDFHRHGKTLKVVASEVDSQRLSLFSSANPECRDIPVADAVAASSAIPLIFRPVAINGKQYVDGGMVSNLPAWTFDEQLINDDQCWTITSESISTAPTFDELPNTANIHSYRPLKGLRLLRNIGFTGLFGGSDLNTRGVSHHLRFPIPVDMGLLDFDAAPLKIATEVSKASVLCHGLIEARIRELEFLEEIHTLAAKELQSFAGEGEELGLRTSLVREMRLTGSEVAGYHLWACKGFDGCADESLKLTKTGTLIDDCLNGFREGATANLETEEGQLRFFRVGRPGFLRTVTPSDRKWAMAFPLATTDNHHSGLGRVSVAMTFDASFSIDGNLEQIRDVLRGLSETWKV